MKENRQKITNIEGLQNSLVKAFETVIDDPTKADQGKALANIAGKVIGGIRLQIEYSVLRKEKPNIPFLNTKRKNA